MVALIPDLPIPIVSYRINRLSTSALGIDDWAILGMWDNKPWPVGSPLKAMCLTDSISQPSPWCADITCQKRVAWRLLCGIYSFKHPFEFTREPWSWGFDPLVITEVQIWGRVFEHELGYRSEFAQITGLVLADQDLISAAGCQGVLSDLTIQCAQHHDLPLIEMKVSF